MQAVYQASYESVQNLAVRDVAAPRLQKSTGHTIHSGHRYGGIVVEQGATGRQPSKAAVDFPLLFSPPVYNKDINDLFDFTHSSLDPFLQSGPVCTLPDCFRRMFAI